MTSQSALLPDKSNKSTIITQQNIQIAAIVAETTRDARLGAEATGSSRETEENGGKMESTQSETRGRNPKRQGKMVNSDDVCVVGGERVESAPKIL